MRDDAPTDRLAIDQWETDGGYTPAPVRLPHPPREIPHGAAGAPLPPPPPEREEVAP
jgi:hypothetical protein